MSELIRASDAERDATIEALSSAVAEGRLTLAEFDERLAATLAATHRGDLDGLTADLPTTRALSPAPAALEQSSVFGDLRLAGSWQVPSEGTWRTVFGDVRLDLRQARVSSPVVHLETQTIFGDVKLQVPAGVAVEIRCRTVFGDVRHRAGVEPHPGAPRVILSGQCLFGDVRVVDDTPHEGRWRRWLRRGPRNP